MDGRNPLEHGIYQVVSAFLHPHMGLGFRTSSRTKVLG